MNKKLGKNADDIFAKPIQKEKPEIEPVVVQANRRRNAERKTSKRATA